jgi:hypothetical protein
MADSIPMLKREQRRHLLMNGWLIAGFIVVGTAVTNERGIFRPVGLDGVSATARAFIAMASPGGLPGLAPRLRDVRSVSGLDPFEVTAPSRDVRRRLIDAIDWAPGEGEGPSFAQPPLGFTIGDVPTNITLADAGNVGGPPGLQQPAFAVPPEQIGVNNPPVVPDVPGGPGVVPEPATWAMLILGFGIVGSILRMVAQQRRDAALAPVRRRRRRAAGNLTA